jgi:hypothetical protein
MLARGVAPSCDRARRALYFPSASLISVDTIAR